MSWRRALATASRFRPSSAPRLALALAVGAAWGAGVLCDEEDGGNGVPHGLLEVTMEEVPLSPSRCSFFVLLC